MGDLLQEKANADYDAFMEYNVMDANALKECKAKVAQFQQKLNDGEKTVRVYGEIIVYEKSLIRMLLQAEQRQGISLKSLKASRIKRIIELFEEGTQIFPSKFRFWDSYIKFCRTNAIELVSEVYKKCLIYHGNRESLWCAAILWDQELGADESQLKDLFLKACIRLPKSEEIYTTYFGIVLKEVCEQISADSENTVTRSKNLERLFAIYESTKKNVGSFSALLSLLKQCEDSKYCEFTVSLQKLLLFDLTAVDSLNEELWDTLAQRELRGFNMCDLEQLPPLKIKQDPGEIDDIKPISNLVSNNFKNPTADPTKDVADSNKNIWKDRPLARRIELCCVTYGTAVRTLKTPKMMQMYISAMLKLNSDMTEEAEVKRSSLVTAFKQGHAFQLLNEEHYFAIVRMLSENQSTKHLALEVLPTAIELHNSFRLYQLWISYYITENEEPKVNEILRLAIKRLEPAFTVSIWKMVIDYYGTLGRNYVKTYQNLLKEACRYTCPSFEIFRPMYLDWCFNYLRIEKTRNQYDTMCKFPPPSLKLHQKMLELESSAPKLNIERLRQCHENAINGFGKDDFTVWIDYIKFEKNQEAINNIVERARNTLHPNLFENFWNSYLLISSKI